MQMYHDKFCIREVIAMFLTPLMYQNQTHREIVNISKGFIALFSIPLILVESFCALQEILILYASKENIA